MYDKTERKVIDWMINTHYIPVLRNVVFLKVERDLKETKDMNVHKRKKELLHRFDNKHNSDLEITNAVSHILEVYKLAMDEKEKLFFFDELVKLYKIIAKHARDLIEGGYYETICNLCKGAQLN